MAEIALVSFAQIVAATTIETNVDEQKLMVFVPAAQRQRLRPVLGADLYDALLAAVAAATDEEPLAEPFAALLEAARSALCWWTGVSAWPLLVVHLTNAGVTMRTGRESTTADLKAADGALVSYREQAEFYTRELAEFLTTNAADYATWRPLPVAPCTVVSPPLIGGIYLG